MKISKKGIDELIKPTEGYKARQPDGSCKAYKCPVGKLTCGWGCTEGVTAHTHWTVAEAEDALAREMRQHEANVERLVTVPLNQGQFDALVSLCYNIGAGNLGKSTLLKHLNAGDYARAASHFADWKYGKVTGDTALRMKVRPGTDVVLPGLVTRRALEAQMFLDADPVIDAMPQEVEPPRMKVSVWAQIKAGLATLAGGGGILGMIGFDEPWIPAAPAALKQSFVNLGTWTDAVPLHDWKQLAVGASAAAAVAAAPWVKSKVMS